MKLNIRSTIDGTYDVELLTIKWHTVHLPTEEHDDKHKNKIHDLKRNQLQDTRAQNISTRKNYSGYYSLFEEFEKLDCTHSSPQKAE